VRFRSFYRAWPIVTLLLLGLSATRALGQSEAESLSTSFRKAVRRVVPAVVTVRDAGAPGPIAFPPGAAPFDQIAPPSGLEPLLPPRHPGGSGVVVDARRGFVLTNDHVIQGSARLAVTLPNGRERIVREVRRDPRSDLALLRIDAEGLQQADWGDSDALETGDWVLAIGQPFGLSGTVTAGIVSGKGRGLGSALSYEDLIQTDAAINPGNSGGPLVNLRGEIVGINVAFKSLNGGYEGVGFAVPAQRARRVAEDLAEYGRVRRAYLGIEMRRVEPEVAERIDQPGAVEVTAVRPGTPAAVAGLRPGDVIVKLQGRPVQGPGMFRTAIEFAPVGERMELAVLRGGQALDLTVQPGEWSRDLAAPGPAPEAAPFPAARTREPEPPLENPENRPRDEPPAPSQFPALGLRLSKPTPALVRRFGLDPDVKGLVIIGVEPESPADRGGLEPGMVLTDLAQTRTRTLAEFRAALAKRPEDRDLVVRILKGSKPEFRVLLGIVGAGDGRR
jgi:serine protease Do